VSKSLTVFLVGVLGLGSCGAFALDAAAPSPVTTQFYSETYASPFNFNPINFQRVQEEFHNLEFQLPHTQQTLTPFASFENYNDLTSTDLALAIGLKGHVIENLQFELALRREYLNEPPLTRWNPRVGLIYGQFWSLPWDSLYADAYAESFYEVPEMMSPFWTFSGWAQVGYRFWEIESWAVDPIVIGVRDNQNANALTVGAQYEMLQLGPQVVYFLEQPQISMSLKLTQTWTSTSSAPVVNGFWYLFAMGVQF